MVSGITYTMGGIAINDKSQALRADNSIIDGLYAVGASTGGLEGGPKIGYVGGLARAASPGSRRRNILPRHANAFLDHST